MGQIIKPAYAQITNPVLKGSQEIAQNPQNYFNNVVQAVISIFLLVGTLYFIWHIAMAGYHIISSQGDPKKYEQGRDEITHSVIGLMIVFSIFAILKFVGIVLGIQGLSELRIAWPTL